MKIKKRKSFVVFVSVIKALFLREIDMRISSGKSGIIWTFLEPFLQIFIFIYIHVALREHTGGASASLYSYSVFMASGFIAFNLYRQIVSRSLGAFVANKGLFNYKQVKPISTIISRIFVEIFLTLCITIVFLFMGFIFDVDNYIPKNILMVCLSVLWLILFSFGIGLVVAIGNFFYMSVGKFIGVISFILLIFSAVFFPLASIPQVARDILLYNPLVHFMEMIHGFYLYGLDDKFVDYSYMLYWTLIPIVIGLWLYVKLEKRIISQ